MNTIIGLIAAMGAMGLALSIVGLYGLVAYAAKRRTKEIGVRMALGAERGDVLRMVMRHGLGLAAVGLVLGLLSSVGAGELLARAFPGGDERPDFVPLILVAAAVLVVTAIATYVPARRAARVDPMEALRYE